MAKRSGSKKVSELKEAVTGIVEAAKQDVELTAEQARDAVHAAAAELRWLGGREGAKPPAKKMVARKKPASSARRTKPLAAKKTKG